MSELREKMIPLVGSRIAVRGLLVKFADWIRNHRDVGRACIVDPELNGQILADHVWVNDVPHWLQYKLELGKQVEFTAIVKRYADRDGSINYCLTNADELVFLHCPPALTIPDVAAVEAAPQPEPDDDPTPDVDADATTADPLETMRQVKQFAKTCGGLDHAERMLEAQQAILLSLPDLLAWIKTLKDE